MVTDKKTEGPTPSRGEQVLQHSLLTRSRDYVPPPGFDPLTAPQDDLATYGIVPRPDPVLQPELYRNWLRIFAPPITFVNPMREEIMAAWQLNSSPARQSAAAISATRFATSSNWSGAFVVPTDDTMFVLVAGLWTIPNVSLPPPEFQTPGATEYVCSTWVGLDGQRLYYNSSLPQIGTMQKLTLSAFAPPQSSAIAFFQWWDRQKVNMTYLQLNGLSVQPGDVMIGAIWAITETDVIGYLRNLSTGEMAIVGSLSPSVPPPGQLTISGASAEWILERPTQFGSTTLYPFPAYATTTFTCWAGAAPTAGPPQSWHDLERARFIRLYDTLHDPTRTVYISMPERRTDTAVRFDYGDFKD